MTINYETETTEILEINNIVYNTMPSDISMYSDNALTEDVYFRSKGAFTFRSRHSNSQVNITFPIPLLDPRALNSYSVKERELFNNGINLIAQLGGFPFCFVRSSRIYSYMGVSYQTPNDYLMFGVQEIKVVQDTRIAGTLLVEVTLILHNHTNMAKDLAFVSDFKVDKWQGLSIEGTVPSLTESRVFADYMNALTGDVMGNYMGLLKELGIVDASEEGNFKIQNTLTNLTIKAPYVSAEDQLKVVDNNSKVVRDLEEDQIDDIEYEEFKMYDKYSNDSTFDGGSLEEFQSKYVDELDFIKHRESYLAKWRMYYLADQDLFNPAINAIQSITITKTNSFATHHIGSSQHPYLQYMGKFPARMTITSIYNNKGSYEHNQNSTMNAFQVLLNSVDSNNLLYPGANAFNYLKVKSVGGTLLGVTNMMPGECTLTSSSDSSNAEMFTVTFVENSLNHLIEESKVGVGREVVSTQRQAAAIIAIFLYVNAVRTAIQTETKEKPFNYKAHMVTMNTLAKLSKEMGVEIRGNNQNDSVDTSGNPAIRTEKSINTFLELTTKTPSKEVFLQILPYADATIKQLGQRAAVQKHKASGGATAGVAGNIDVTNRNKATKSQSVNETYNFSGLANNLIEQLTTDIAKMKESGFIRLQESGSRQAKTAQELNDQFLQHSFVGDTQRDLNLERFQPDVEIRRFLDPFFFVAPAPILKQPDFYTGFNIMGTEAVKNIKTVVSKEINGGVLEGSSNTQELISEMSELSEKRYTATNAEDRPDIVAKAGLDGGSGNGQNAFGSGTGNPGGSAVNKATEYAARWNEGNIGHLSDAMTRRLYASILLTESHGGVFGVTNDPLGFSGAFQAGATWLIDGGFMKNPDEIRRLIKSAGGLAAWARSGGQKKYVDNPANWVSGVNRGIFLTTPSLQNKMFHKVTNMNYKTLLKAGVISANTPERQVAGYLKAMHLGGLKGAKAVKNGGSGGRDDNGTSPKKYYNDIVKNNDGLDAKMKSRSDAPVKTASTSNKASTPSKRDNGTPKPSSKKSVDVTSIPPKGTKINVTVESVLDGDTLRVYSKEFMKGVYFDIRIKDIDAPEIAHGKKEGQFLGEASRDFANRILLGKTLPARITGITKGRAEGDVRLVVGGVEKYFGEIAVEAGTAYAVSNSTDYAALEAKAKAAKVGVWKQPDRTLLPKVFRDTVGTDKMKPQYTEKGGSTAASSGTTAKQPGKDAQGNTKTSVPNYPLQNSFKPVADKDITKLSSSFGKRKNPNTAHRRANGTAGKIGWHYGIDISAPKGSEVRASCDGSVTVTTGGARGNCVTLYCDAQGFQCIYMHLSAFGKVRKGPVKAGDVIGYVGSTGSSTGNHLHYEVKFNNVNVNPFYTMELSKIPKFTPLKSGDYIAKQAFMSSTDLDKTSISGQAGAQGLYNKSTISVSTAMNALEGGYSVENMSMADIKGYEIGDVVMDTQQSVFDEPLQVVKHVEKMFSNFDMGLNLSFPIIKAYAVVGNESDNIFTSEVPLQPALYFDLPNLHDLNVATNNDYNPVDVCTFSMVNPSSTRSSTDFYGASDFGANVYNLDTQYYNLFYADRIKLKPGMKIHIKAGYSNSPGKLKTIFNGIIKEVSGSSDLLVNVVCESYGAELLSNSMGYNKPLDMSNGKNASTGLLIAYSLLEDTVSHFGSKPSVTKTALAYDAVLGDLNSASAYGASLGRKLFGDGIIGLFKEDTDVEESVDVDKFGNPIVKDEVTLDNLGDYRDPESKRLIAPLNWGDLLGAFNPSRANLAQRLFTNIFSDAIEGAHDQYKSDLWTRIDHGLEIFDAKMFYKYYAFRSTTWSVLKEMEYRHPGTLAKPLWYDERMTMFYGIKEQLYIAKDLTPSYMFESGKASKANDVNKPYSGDYLLERHKRLEPATGFHLLSSKLNIIDNDLTISRDFATRINVIYYDDEYEGNKIQPESDSFTIDLDDNIAPFDIREETISLNGCHGKYMSWMYGIQELKKQTETMYRGTITVTGKPDMRAGDYAYLEDSDRGMSGVIKIRECNHHFSSTSGYITVITPGMHVECTQFYWSSLFTQLGMASKMVLMKAELNVNHLLTTNKVADSYYEYLKLIQSNQGLSFSDKVFGGGGTVLVSGLTMMFLWKMGSKSSALKNGMTWAEYNARWTKAANFAKVSKNYAQVLATDVGKSAWESVLKKHRKTLATLNAAGPQPTGGVPTKILTQIKKMSQMKIFGSLKLLKNVPWGAVKGVIGVGATVTKGLLGILAVTPLGAILNIVGALLFGVVMSKFREIELTHNPLLLFPITYNGKPYVAGMSGFENNSFFEGYMTNLERNIAAYKKAAQGLRATSQGTSTGANVAETAVNTAATLSKIVESSSRAVADFINMSSDEGY